MIEKIAQLIKSSEGISVGITGYDPYYLREVAKSLPELVEGFPPQASDYIVVDPKGTDIGIEDVREISSFLSYSPEISKKKYVLVFDIDRMTQQAANAFLKTLEEPPRYGVIIATTTRWDYLLPTIKSRLVRFFLQPPPPQEEDPILSKIMEKDWRTRKEKNAKEKRKKIEKTKVVDLIKMVNTSKPCLTWVWVLQR